MLGVYLVSWPADRIVKVGVTEVGRHRQFMRHGAVLNGFWPTPYAYEVEQMIRAVDCRFDDAFTDRADAAPYLGGRGSGYLECRRVTDLPAAVAMLQASIDSCSKQCPLAIHERTNATNATNERGSHLPHKSRTNERAGETRQKEIEPT